MPLAIKYILPAFYAFSVQLAFLLVLPRLCAQPQAINWTGNTGESTYVGNITTMFQDSRGYLWFGGTHGALRFDGLETRIFDQNSPSPTSLTSDIVTALSEDHAGHIWMGTFNGVINIYDPIRDSIKYITSSLSEDASSDGVIYSICPDHNQNIWVGTTLSGLRLFPANTDTSIYYLYTNKTGIAESGFPNSINKIIVDLMDTSTLWLGMEAGLVKFDISEESFVSFVPQKLESEEFKKTVIDLEITKDGNIYSLFWNTGLFFYDRDNNSFTELLDLQSVRQFSFINDFSILSDTELLLATDEGIYILDMTQSLLRPYSEELLDNEFFYSFADRSGIQWFSGTTDKRVMTDDPQQVKTKSLDISGQYNTPYYRKLITGFDIDPGNENLILSAFGMPGLLHFDLIQNQVEFIEFKEETSTRKKVIYLEDVAFIDDQIWVSALSDLFLFDLESSSFTSATSIWGNKFNVEGRYITSLFKISDKSLALRVEDYLIFFNTESGDFKKVFLGHEEVNEVLFPILDISLGLDSLLYVVNAEGSFIIDPSDHSLITIQSDINTPYYPTAIAALDTTSIYIGTRESGIKIGSYNNGEFRITDSINYTESRIYDIYVLSNRNLIFRTQCGIYKYFSEVKRIKQIASSLCLGETPFIGDKISNGKYLSGSYPKMVFVDTADIILNPFIPDLTLQEIKGTNTKIIPDIKNGIAYVRLKKDDNFFSINFAGITFRNPEKTLFKYRLKGYDKDWITTSERTSRYTGVPPGNYVFEIKASNESGIWSETDDMFYLEIVPPWWWSTWAKILWALIILALITFAYKLRTTWIRDQEAKRYDFERQLAGLELKVLRAQMNPHFMFNSLNSIKNYILKSDSRTASEYLSSFAHLIRMILQHSRENMISLKEELDTLLLYIDLEKMRFKDGFDFSCRIDDKVNLEEVQIPPMILQPFIENAIWHGLLHKEEDRSLSISADSLNEKTVVRIEDNGIGRQYAEQLKSKSATKYKSMGMSITSDRIKLLNQINDLNIEVNIMDLTDNTDRPSGTRVILEIPIVTRKQPVEITKITAA